MLPHVSHLPGSHCKNLFVRDKKKKGLWLISARHNADVNLSELAKQINAPGGLRLADESVLIEKLGVRQGCVTPFSLINDTKNEVTLLLDEDLLQERDRIYFHPMVNSSTTGIKATDFTKFLQSISHSPVLIKFKV